MGRAPMSSGRIQADGTDDWILLPDGITDVDAATAPLLPRRGEAAAQDAHDRPPEGSLMAALLASVTRSRH
jgi:hypothetical protein